MTCKLHNKIHKTKNFFATLLLASTFTIGVCGFTSCKDENTEVTVNTNGGTMTNINLEENAEIADIIKTKPEKEGFIFGGWYSDEEMTRLITDDTDLDSVEEVYAKWITVEEKTYSVRSDSATITDSGRHKQRMDIVYLSSDFDWIGMEFAGYKTIKITVTLDIMEKDDGYQHVFLYSDTDCVSSFDKFSTGLFGSTPNDPSLLAGYTFEHGGSTKNTNWGNHSFSATINVSQMKDDLYIRYGASGKLGDDWCNRYVTVKVKPV